MTHRSASPLPILDARVRAAWQSQLAAARKRPGLLPELMRRRGELLPRFAAHYGNLRRLPRRLRRALQRRWAASLAGVALALALAATPGAAATISVGGGCTLAAAIVAANTDAATGTCSAGSDADTITLPPGSTHTFTTSTDQTYGPTALPTITSAITIAGNGGTIRRDPAASSFRLLAVARSGDLTIQDTTITGGTLSEDDGGAIYNFVGNLTLQGSTISNNAAEYGGGISNFAGRVTLTNCSISGNTSLEGGGGVFSTDGSVFLWASAVTGNTAADGGGIGGYGYRNAITVMGTTVSGNSATGSDGGYGGGIAVYKSSLGVSDSTISGNTARGGGGGVAIYLSLNASIGTSTLAGNTAGNYGGGVDVSRAVLTLWSSTISSNTAAHGGGASNEGASSGLIVRGSTIARNTALETGGGVYATAPFVLGRSLVSGNTATLAGAEVFSTPGNTAYVNDFNLFGHDGAAGVVGFTPGGNDLVPGAALAGILASSLADNGGPTQTLALVAGSPAIDASPASDFCFPTDQRGVTRPQGAACDIGAFEAMVGGGGGVEICGNCVDDDGDGLADLADADCASRPLSTEKGTLSLKPDPTSDQISLTTAFPTGAQFNPRLEGATVSFFDAAGRITCVRLPAETTAVGAWKEKTASKGTSWTFKDAKDGSVGDPTKETFSLKCDNAKATCTAKVKVKLADLAGDGTARTITTGLAIGDDAWTKQQPWQSKSKGTKLSTP